MESIPKVIRATPAYAEICVGEYCVSFKRERTSENDGFRSLYRRRQSKYPWSKVTVVKKERHSRLTTNVKSDILVPQEIFVLARTTAISAMDREDEHMRQETRNESGNVHI